MNIYVGNVFLGVSENDLRQAFEAYGQVKSVKIIKDSFSGESRGFGFVEMPHHLDARTALSGLNGKSFKGRTLKVSEARPRNDRQSGFGWSKRY